MLSISPPTQMDPGTNTSYRSRLAKALSALQTSLTGGNWVKTAEWPVLALAAEVGKKRQTGSELSSPQHIFVHLGLLPPGPSMSLPECIMGG